MTQDTGKTEGNHLDSQAGQVTKTSQPTTTSKTSKGKKGTKAKKPERPLIYCSTDVEADGPIPGANSLLSFATAAYTADKTLVGTFTANLELTPGTLPDPDTMAWWGTQPDAWAACRTALESPEAAMRRYVAWVRALPGTPVFVAYPAAYDFMWVYWYCLRFAGESPYKRNALDIRSFVSGMTGKPFPKCGKESMPKSWFDPLPHTHQALDDAMGQGALFINILTALGAASPTRPITGQSGPTR